MFPGCMEIKFQKVLQNYRQQELQMQGQMRLTKIKESQTKKNGTREVSFVRRVIVDE